jgi:hypothetical protein
MLSSAGRMASPAINLGSKPLAPSPLRSNSVRLGKATATASKFASDSKDPEAIVSFRT